MSIQHLSSGLSWGSGATKIMEAYRIAEDALGRVTPIVADRDDYDVLDEQSLALWEFDDTATIMRASFLCLLYSRFEYSLGQLCDSLQSEFHQKFSHADVTRHSYVTSRIGYIRKILGDVIFFPKTFRFDSELANLSSVRNFVVHACGDFADILGPPKPGLETRVQAWINANPSLAQIYVSKIHFEPALIPHVHNFLSTCHGEIFEAAVSKRKRLS